MLQIDEFGKEFLYVNSLTAGVVSNDIGLACNQLSDTPVVYFDKRGSMVLLVQLNYSYRAITDNMAERQSVRDAFAQSILWCFEIQAAEDGSVLVDITDFLMRDAHNVIGEL